MESSLRSRQNVNDVLTSKKFTDEQIATQLENMPSEMRKVSIDGVVPDSDEEKDRKPSVTFVEDQSLEHEVDAESDFSASPIMSVSISGEQIPHDILVAMRDRDTEMRELVSLNKEFFGMIRRSLDSRETWRMFLGVIYSPRERLPDKIWIEKIQSFLHHAPSVLHKFYELVGYDAVMWDGYYEEENDGPDFEEISILAVRDLTDTTLTQFEQSYPQFFINVHEHLQQRNPKDAENQYNTFKTTLFSKREELSDYDWLSSIEQFFNGSPTLESQLKELIAYEIENDESESGEPVMDMEEKILNDFE